VVEHHRSRTGSRRGIGDPGCVWFGKRGAMCTARRSNSPTATSRRTSISQSHSCSTVSPRDWRSPVRGPCTRPPSDGAHPYEITGDQVGRRSGRSRAAGVTEDETLTETRSTASSTSRPRTAPSTSTNTRTPTGTRSTTRGEDAPRWGFSPTVPFPTKTRSRSSYRITDENGEIVSWTLSRASTVVTETLKEGWISTTGLSAEAEGCPGQETALWFGNKEKEVVPAIDLDHEGRRPRRGRARRDGRSTRYVLEQQRHPRRPTSPSPTTSTSAT